MVSVELPTHSLLGAAPAPHAGARSSAVRDQELQRYVFLM